MKHLKVRATVKPKAENFEIKVIDSTHQNDKFGGGQAEITNADNRKYIFLHGSLMIVHLSGANYFMDGEDRTHWGVPKKYDKLLYLDKDKPTSVPLKHWPEVKAAIEAYNEHYKED